MLKIKSYPDHIRLDRNESYSFLNEKILSEIKDFNSDALSLYPDLNEVKDLLAKHTGLKTENVLATHGSEQAIRLTVQSLFKKGDEVIMAAPIFIAFTLALKHIEVIPKILLYKERKGNFFPPTTQIVNLINKNTKGVVLCNPSNPLGCSISRRDILKILKKTASFNVPVIVDEVYSEFSGTSFIDLTKKYDNLIILKSFSKEFGLAGLRLGYIVANSEIIEKLDDEREMFWPISNFSIHTLRVLLKHKPYFKKQIAGVVQRKKKLISFLKQRSVRCYDTDTNFVIIKSKNHKDIIQEFEAEKILVSDISTHIDSGNLLHDAFRISIPSEKDFKQVIKILKRLF